MRINKIKFLTTTLLVALIIRLWFLSFVQGQYLKEQAFSQQTTLINNDAARKYIYDKDMRVIAGGVPRYKDNTKLSHIIGYTWDGGASGIEKAFFDKLIKENPDYVALQNDASGKTVSKTHLNNENDFSGISLTIDYHIQTAVEEVMEDEKLTGAVVVVDAKTGGILAMASKPDFKRDNIAQYYDSKNGELMNRALCQYNVGSVFKIVTAAAALETLYSYEYVFECTGNKDVDGISFVCNKEDGHGVVSFTEGFAYSCNCLFYELGINTGYDNIRKYAYDFGFGEEILRINGFDEYRGNLPKKYGISNSDVANISIGQGEILATPLQVADMMCTVANNGIRKQLMLINGYVDGAGVCNEINAVDMGRVISVDTARALKQMLKEAVEYGTGINASVERTAVSGKTSTAESGWLIDENTMTHGWFAGYFPSENPEYVCVVLAENGNYGSVSAAPVFKEICERILDYRG